MKANKFGWWYRLIVKILIPVMFFMIANTGNKDVANALAGVMVIAVVFYYILIWQKVGDKKE
jgi:hypothetical protein